MTERRRYELDHAYDRANADIGTGSRYGNYLYSRQKNFTGIFEDDDFYDDYDPSLRFAFAAWDVATGPVMSPPFVRAPRLVLGTNFTRSEENGEAIMDVELVCPRPAALRNVATAGGSYFRDWSTDAFGQVEPVGSRELTKASYLFTRAQVLVQIPPGTLPTVKTMPVGSGRLIDQAVQCVQAMVDVLNREVGPLVDRLEGSW